MINTVAYSPINLRLDSSEDEDSDRDNKDVEMGRMKAKKVGAKFLSG